MESNGTTVTSEPKLDMYKAVTDPPQWLTKAYIEKALKDSEKDPSLKVRSIIHLLCDQLWNNIDDKTISYQLSDYRIVAATKPGDNFASVALRLRASYHTKGKDISKSFIIKVEHYEEGFKKEAMADAVLFETEIAMYTKTIPEMQRLIREVDADEIIAPPISYSNLKPYKIVFIDDISPEFIMSEKPLDFEESLLVFEKIASFHALSFFMGEDHEPMQQYTSGFISSHLEKTSSFLVQTMMAVGRVIAQWSDQMKVAGEKLQALEPTIFKKLMKLFVKNDLTGYNVLNHGDFHIKNILFRDQANYGKAVDKTRLVRQLVDCYIYRSLTIGTPFADWFPTVHLGNTCHWFDICPVWHGG